MERSLRGRLEFDLGSVRKELVEHVSRIQSAEFGYAPSPGMKSYRDLIVEIGAMEVESCTLLATGVVPSWADCEARVRGDTAQDLLASLNDIRRFTLVWLEDATPEDLAKAIPIPESWWPYMGREKIEAEEFIRWISRHEYYHLGQIITYRWIQGHNPYRH